ncbi:LCP family protein [Planobispora takensis]|uniref:LCP family protein n=1 Tax=Planobispora takensis TaxID=1367882 RepID=UPI001EF2ED95|nr:LCP family protein [Planobispora takensis]
MGDWQEDDDRTRALRSPASVPPRAAGQPAHPVPGQAPGQGGAPGRRGSAAAGPQAGVPLQASSSGGAVRDDTVPRAVSQVYGKARSGTSPVRPLKGPSDGPQAGPPGSPLAGSAGGSSGGKGGAVPNVSSRSKSPRGPRRTGRLIARILIGLLVLLLVLAVAGYFTIDGRMKRIDALTDYEGRPADTPGTTWLLVGSDSREGLTKAQRRKLATGSSVGRRTDTMMLLHIPDNDGRPTLVSLPRDSYVPIEGHGSAKLNAAYSFQDGGPALLAKTVEKVTGLRIDNYMEIGFAGFVGIVDAIGGVEIDVKQNINDPKAGIKLKKGVQTLDGATALGYVRTRQTGATGIPDFERTQRQRQFFSAVVKKAASPGVLINPFTSVPLAFSAADSVAVGQETGVFDLLSLGLAMGDNPVTTIVPFSGFEDINGENVVRWDRDKALRMFEALAQDKQVPKDVLAK